MTPRIMLKSPLSLRGVPPGTTRQSPQVSENCSAPCPTSSCPESQHCHCEEPRRGDVAIPLGIRRLPRPMPHVILRYAVEGIASSLRGLAPRNDKSPGQTRCRGEAFFAPTGDGREGFYLTPLGFAPRPLSLRGVPLGTTRQSPQVSENCSAPCPLSLRG